MFMGKYEGQILNYYDKDEGDDLQQAQHGYGRQILKQKGADGVYQYQIREGQWYFGKMDGFGRLINQHGNVYIGIFDEDEFHGLGRYFFKNGDLYDGNWRKSKFHGKGSFYHNESELTYVGDFNQGKVSTNYDAFDVVDGFGYNYPAHKKMNSPVYLYLDQNS